ncbi:MAG TPA: YtxH domain-containing protein [Gemmatimonadaceae bacterium]|nr:YtxH domain-containing protein [Gemmatimonadaceae bacterium]
MPHDRDLDEARLRTGGPAIASDSLDSDPPDEVWEDEDSDAEEAEEEWMTGGAWRQTGAAAAGLVFGLALGAGLALLFAPRAGDETRELLGERARMLRGLAGDRFEDLRGDLGRVTRRGRRRMRRGVTRGRWAAEDMLYRAGW